MKGKKRINAWVLGGDGRYPWAVRALRRSGLPVKAYGVLEMDDQAGSLEDALWGADLVLLPMKPFQDGYLRIGNERLQASMLPILLERGALLIAGSFPAEEERWLRDQGVRCSCVLDLAAFQMQNARITADGAVELAKQHAKLPLADANILIIGWGRIGKCLAWTLSKENANITVSARRDTDLSEIALLGLRPEHTGAYRHGLDYDLIINTVPAQVMDVKQASAIKEDCMLLELASEPGGFPAEALERVTVARGLPGTYAPRTAGALLCDAVWSCLAGEGRTLE